MRRRPGKQNILCDVAGFQKAIPFGAFAVFLCRHADVISHDETGGGIADGCIEDPESSRFVGGVKVEELRRDDRGDGAVERADRRDGEADPRMAFPIPSVLFIRPVYSSVLFHPWGGFAIGGLSSS